MRARSGAIEVPGNIHLRLKRWARRGKIAVHCCHNPPRLVNIRLLALARAPTLGVWGGHKTIARRRHSGIVVQAERHAKNVWRVRLHRNRFAPTIECQPLVRILRQGAGGGERNSGNDCNSPV